MKKQYYDNISIINMIQRMTGAVDRQNYIYVVNQIPVLSAKLSAAFTNILAQGAYMESVGLPVTEDDIVNMMSGLLNAQEQEDYVLYGDLLMLQVYPFFIEVQNAIRAYEGFFYDETLWDVNMQKLVKRDQVLFAYLKKAKQLHKKSSYCDCIYEVEPTTVGAFTLKICEADKCYYIHSNDNPYREAYRFVEEYYDVHCDHYVGFGLGLGYHWQALIDRDPDMILEIIEPDIRILQLVFQYMDMNWYFQNENVKIYYDPEYEILEDRSGRSDQYHFVPLRAYIRHIYEPGTRNILRDWLLRDNTIRQYRQDFIRNSRSNFQNCDAYIDELETSFHGKRVVLIAGGPSLDKNVKELYNKPENTIYVAVGTVLRKLLKLGILPDYVVISDPKRDVYVQIEGLEQEKIPMILLSTAYRKIAQSYKGRKYLVCQTEYEEAEQYAGQHGYRLYQVGGSVITLALDIAIRMRAAQIICMGLDLAFTGERDHASDTRQTHSIDTDGTITVCSIDGDMVHTNRSFDRYRRWIEQRLRDTDVNMPVYDATEGGALIQGMQIARTCELLKTEEADNE